MKFQLTAGAELDLVTPAELRELLAEFEAAAPAAPVTVRAAENGVTSGAGLLELEVFKVPLGMVFALNRVLLEADGFTPAAPFTNAAGWVDVLRTGKRVDFFSLAAAPGLPAISVDGGDQASRFINGETIVVRFNGGPAATNLEVTIQGQLSPQPAQQSRKSGRHGHGRR